MPNTPRERLAWIRDRALLATQVAAANPNVPECVAEIGQCVAELSDLLLSADAGLLDRAGSGERQGAAEAQARSGALSATDATVPPTPDQPNDWTLDDGQVIRLITPEQLAKLPKGYPLTCIDGSRVVVGFDKIDGDTRFGYLAYGNLVTNDSGLLDQANEGGGEGKANGEAHELRADDPLPDATVPQPPIECEVMRDSEPVPGSMFLWQRKGGSGEVQRIASVMNPSISDEGLGSTVPHPTPASVIREFMRVERGGDSPTGWTGDPFLDVDAMATEIVRLRSSPAPESVEGMILDNCGAGVLSDGRRGVIQRVELPDVGFPKRTKVRIQRISE